MLEIGTAVGEGKLARGAAEDLGGHYGRLHTVLTLRQAVELYEERGSRRAFTRGSNAVVGQR